MDEAREMRAEIRLTFDFGQAVRERRAELGMSPAELALRAGMPHAQLTALELGGTVPTLPLLARLAGALEASLTITHDTAGSKVAFLRPCAPEAARATPRLRPPSGRAPYGRVRVHRPVGG